MPGARVLSLVRVLRCASTAVASGVLLAGAGPAGAATPILEVAISSDVTMDLSGTVADDEALILDDLDGGVGVLPLGGLAAAADLQGLTILPDGGLLLSFEAPESIDGVLVAPNQVLSLGSGPTALYFDGAAHGIPAGVAIDAISTFGPDLLLSFDTDVDLGSFVAADEDVVRFDGVALSLHLDGSDYQIPEAADLDSLHLVEANRHLLVSFDTSGQVGGVDFDDEDVLELDPVSRTWQLALAPAVLHPGWAPGDLDALYALTDADGDGLSDPDEVAAGTDLLDPDSDDDGLLDGVEDGTGVFVDPQQTGTDPLDPDSDDDGFSDGDEVAAGSDPNDPQSTPLAVPTLPGAASLLLSLLLGLALAGVHIRSSGRRIRP